MTACLDVRSTPVIAESQRAARAAVDLAARMGQLEPHLGLLAE